MKQQSRYLFAILLAVIVTAGVSTPAFAQPPLGSIMRLSADFQWCDPGPPAVNCFEISTIGAPGGPPGFGTSLVTFEKTQLVGRGTLFVTFSGQGDTHALPGGDSAALLMTCTIDSGAGEAFCNPLGGLGSAGPDGWSTLLKLPTNGGAGGGFTGCGPGGGGDAGGGAGDCHDNKLYATWCINIETAGPKTIRLRLASSNGAVVFYERAHIIIDQTHNKVAPNRCINLAPPA